MSGNLDERGVTLVETAFVLPVVILFAFALIDFGLWAFATTQAASAARDGARVAILDYPQADVAGSVDNVGVRTGALRHVDVPAATVSVRCEHEDGSEVTCASAAAGVDRVRVSVSWDRSFLTFVGAAFGGRTARVSAASAMVINGRPLPAAG